MHASVTTMDVDLADLAPERLRRFTGREFDEMCKHGILSGPEHVELLDGVLVAMNGQEEPHARVSAWFAQVLIRALDFDAYDVRSHSTFAPSESSRPEPDIAVFRRNRSLVTLPSQALLLVEVAHSSLRKDRVIKVPLYAACGVPEYWIVDVHASAVEVYTGPTPTGYARAAIYRTPDALRPVALPGIAIAVADIPFRPAAP